jgi:allophanate hydrolase subunit 2
MTPSLRVVEPGLLATVQDLGRVGWQRFGIPVSGAADPIALRAANVVVGNAQHTAGLEMVMLGPTFEVAAESVRIAVAGGTTSLSVHRAGGDEPRRIGPLESATLVRGDRLRVGPVAGTAAAYLAVAGGFALEPFLGSLSTYLRGGFGGLQGRALRAGDSLPLVLDQAPDRDDVRL